MGSAATPSRSRTRWPLLLLAGLLLLGVWRGLAFWGHTPLWAYGNTYDEVRYTSCFQLFPDRDRAVPLDAAHADGPLTRYRYHASEIHLCYWSSELVVDAVALGASWLAGARDTFNIRWLGLVRLLALFALVGAFVAANLRRGQRRAAVAHAALLALLFVDPIDALFASTFYAEWIALAAAYATLGAIMLWRDEAWTRRRGLLTALAALALATSKVQHAPLPLALGALLLVWDRRRARAARWQGWVLLGVGLVAGTFQAVNQSRDAPVMRSIRAYNRANVLFTGLLPFVDDREAFLRALDIDPACARFSERPAWELPEGQPDKACPDLVKLTRARQLGVLVTHPGLLLRSLDRAFASMYPGLQYFAGHVEGGQRERIDDQAFSLSTLLRRYRVIELSVLTLPLHALAIFLMFLRQRRRAVELVALVCTVMASTLFSAVLGDGLAAMPVHTHLTLNAALAFALVACVQALLPADDDQAPTAL